MYLHQYIAYSNVNASLLCLIKSKGAYLNTYLYTCDRKQLLVSAGAHAPIHFINAAQKQAPSSLSPAHCFTSCVPVWTYADMAVTKVRTYTQIKH